MSKWLKLPSHGQKEPSVMWGARNKLNLEGLIKAAKLMKRWMYINTDKAELLSQCSYNTAAGWFLPTSSNDYLSQNKPFWPRSCLYHPKLFLPTRNTKSLPAVIWKFRRSAASNYKSNTTYPVLSWKVHSNFLTFFASVTWSEAVIIVYSRRCSSGLQKWVKQHQRKGRGLVSLLKTIHQRANHRGSSSLMFWFHSGLRVLSPTLSHYTRDRGLTVLGI